MLPRIVLLLFSLLPGACAVAPPAEEITVSGSLIEVDGKFYLQSSAGKYHLNWMPQLHYRRYIGEQLVIRGEIPEQCAQTWQDSVIEVNGGAELIDWSKVDWSQCLAAKKVSLVTADGVKLVYDWQKINMQDYYF